MMLKLERNRNEMHIFLILLISYEMLFSHSNYDLSVGQVPKSIWRLSIYTGEANVNIFQPTEYLIKFEIDFRAI